TNNTTDSVSAATSVSVVCAKLPVSSHPNIDSLNNAVSPAKHAQAMSHTTELMDPIIKEWVSDSDDEYKPNDPHSVFVQPIEVPILAATPKPTIMTSSSVPAVMLPKSKPVSVTAVRQVSDAVPKIMKSRPRPAHPLNKKSNPSIRRYQTHNQYSKTSNSSSKVTAAKVSVVSAVKGKKGKWVWRPKCPILDHDSRTSELIPRVVRFQVKER
nr:hypothetical protein [Tanacetum cinerariifolium]